MLYSTTLYNLFEKIFSDQKKKPFSLPFSTLLDISFLNLT